MDKTNTNRVYQHEHEGLVNSKNGVSKSAQKAVGQYDPDKQGDGDPEGVLVYMEKQPDKQIHHNHWDNQVEFVLSCIGYAVGLGNIWRFPYLVMQNGGGAFLIPYFLAMLVCGTPLFLLELSIGQFSGLSPLQIWDICPLMKGLGYGMVIVSGIVCIYYNVIITWVLYYLFKSLTRSLPWGQCNNDWNTPLCYDSRAIYQHSSGVNDTDSSSPASVLLQLMNNSSTEAGIYTYEEWQVRARTYANLTANQTVPRISPAEEFWQNEALQMSGGIGQLGGIKWDICGCFLLGWLIVFLCLFKGIKSSGKVVYVTATAPYIFLVILIIRGATLPGAIDGIKFYIIPQWRSLLSLKVWAVALIQVFYSLGPAWGGLITMSSYNRFNNNIIRDSILVPLVTGGTSLFAGFALFSVVGYMSHQTGRSVSDFVKSGPGLAFIMYPEALTHLPVSPLWAILFFLMLLTVGLDSQFGMFETLVSSVVDQMPKHLRKWKILYTALICVVEAALGVLFVTRAGIYYFQIMDWYAAAFSVTIIALFECVTLAWLYGHERLYRDIEMMIGSRPNIVWKICWCFVTPSILVVILLYSAFYMSEPQYGDYVYPRWAIAMGWCTGMISLIPIPVFAVKAIVQQEGTFLQRLKKSIRPTSLWGPQDLECNTLYKREHKSQDLLVFCVRQQTKDRDAAKQYS